MKVTENQGNRTERKLMFLKFDPRSSFQLSADQPMYGSRDMAPPIHARAR